MDAALAHALASAAKARRFDVVAQVVCELVARRLAHANDVVNLSEDVVVVPAKSPVSASPSPSASFSRTTIRRASRPPAPLGYQSSAFRVSRGEPLPERRSVSRRAPGDSARVERADQQRLAQAGVITMNAWLRTSASPLYAELFVLVAFELGSEPREFLLPLVA